MSNLNQPKRPGGLHAFMVRWNELAEKAAALGGIPGVKVHTSEFESYVIAERRVNWLEAQIEAKKPLPSVEQATADNRAINEQVPVTVEAPAKKAKRVRKTSNPATPAEVAEADRILTSVGKKTSKPRSRKRLGREAALA
jgi:hypothetical protein